MFAEFDLEMPDHLEEAVYLLANSNGAETLPIAGGSNLIVDIRARRVSPDRLISLSRIGELRGIQLSGGRMTLGGRTTVSDLVRSPEIAAHGASLVDSARVFAGQKIGRAHV